MRYIHLEVHLNARRAVTENSRREFSIHSLDILKLGNTFFIVFYISNHSFKKNGLLPKNLSTWSWL